MSDIIRLLPDSIANQIAAGEVVQRPASVVKELLENALDAGATQISLLVREAGSALIQVTDNGSGMSETDARMCFERHATSKIRQAQDLWAIRTMGFRGEAMASISAVARVELTTRLHHQAMGTEVVIEGSKLIHVRPAALAQPGTRVQVKNLFFNTPARRAFLKTPQAELRHLTEELVRVALARPDVAFDLFRGDEHALRLPKARLAQRIVGLFARTYAQGLVPLEEAAGYYSVRGYVGRPELARKTRGEQYFFVNGRFIRHPFLHHAVTSALEGLLPADYHPFYVLYIDTDPGRIDVNVHPTKTEVKFDDERSLYAILFAAVRRAISAWQLSPSLDFDSNADFVDSLTATRPTPSPHQGPASSEPPMADKSPGGAGRPGPPLPPPPAQSGRAGGFGGGGPMRGGRQATAEALWQQLVSQSGGRQARFEQGDTPAAGPSGEGGEGPPPNLFPHIPSPQDLFALPSAQAGLRPPGGRGVSFGGRYLALPVKSGLLLVDLEAALERIYFERFATRRGGDGASQQSVFPVRVEISALDAPLFEELSPELERLGFTLDPAGPGQVDVLGIPPEATPGRERELIEGLMEQYKHHRAELSLPRPELAARAMATRAARMAVSEGPALEGTAIDQLIQRLFTCRVPSLAPGGRPTTLLVDLPTLAGWFSGDWAPGAPMPTGPTV